MAAELASLLDARTALLFALQPLFSFVLALAMVALAIALFRPQRPWVRAALWLVPIAKIALDLAAASSAHWVGSQGVHPETMKKGSRIGSISIGLTGDVPVLFGAVKMEYSRDGEKDPKPRADGQPVMRAYDFGLLHPGDLLYGKLGRAGALALVALCVAIGLAKAAVRTVRLFAFRRWLAAKQAGGRPLEDATSPTARWPEPRVYVVPGLAVPFATGFLSPRILVPEALTQSLSADELAALLAHERAHLRRADPLVRVLLGYLRDLFWYVPGLAGCVERFQAEREADCDDAARAHDAGDALAHALLKTHDWVRALSPAIPGLAPSWAPAAVESSTLGMRLKRLVVPPHESSRVVRVLATLGWAYVALVVLKSSLAGLS